MALGLKRVTTRPKAKAAPVRGAGITSVETADPEGFAFWCATLGTVAIGEREFPIDMEALDRWMADQPMGQSTLQALQRNRAAVVRAFLDNDPDAGLQAIEDLHVRVHAVRQQPLAHSGAKRRAAERELQARGANARRKYTKQDHELWRKLRSTKFAEHTAKRAAELIVKECGLPEEATSSVRAELGPSKKAAKSL